MKRATLLRLTSYAFGLITLYGLYTLHAPAWLWVGATGWSVTTGVWAALREADNNTNTTK